MDRDPVTFQKVFVLGDVVQAVVPAVAGVERFPADTVAGAGHLPVDAAIQWARERKQRRERVLILTDRDLFIPECASLFGFADVKHRVALVSTARLATADPVRTQRRVRNAIAHEAAHLDGLRHCRGNCLMHAASSPADLDERPFTPCGRCPRGVSAVTLFAIAVAAGWLMILTAAPFIDRVPHRLRKPPAIPPAFAATFADLPWDPGEVYGRPVSAVAQDIAGALANRLPIATDLPLLPALTAELLPRLTPAIVSVLYRTPETEPVVYVHGLDLPSGSSELAAALGCRGQMTEASTCHVTRDGTDVHAVTLAKGQRAIVVFSPRASGRDMAARLASTAGTGGGLLRDPDMKMMIDALPAVLPDGTALQSVVANNLHRVPESFSQLAAWALGPDHAERPHAQSVLPYSVVVARYRDRSGAKADVVIGDYGNRVSSWIGARSIVRRLAPRQTGSIEFAGATGRTFAADRWQAVVVRRGQFLVAAIGDRATAASAWLRALIDAAQL